MKKIVSFMLLFFLCAGCLSSDISPPAVDPTALLALEAAAFSSGQMIAEKKPELIEQTLNYYMDVNPENITINDLNHGIHTLKLMDVDPVYINLLLRLADQIGMTVDFNDGIILDIMNMNDTYFSIALEGFMNGVALGVPKCGD